MDKRVIALVHNAPPPASHALSEASLDVLTQVENIENALVELGYKSVSIPFTKDVSAFLQKIREKKVGMAFNLCETVDENPRFEGHPAALLELLSIPFSGSPSMTLMLTTDKVMTKRLLIAKGIRTPNYLIYDGTEKFNFHVLRFPVVVKPRFKNASIGIGQHSVFQDTGDLRRGLREFLDLSETLLVEEYISGKEFNVSLFGHPSVNVLPVEEVDFSALPEGIYSTVGYCAKWDRASFGYHNTPRKFPKELPKALLRRMESTALDSFHLLMLRDYGRVDMRVDDSGRIHVLAVKANPCLSLDAGFAAAAQKAGIGYKSLVSDMLNFMIRRDTKNGQYLHHHRI
jgi:D-alanine-D-alanine ligase